ncbi:potassium channel subfamily K member 17 [Microtus oregoni]|uniref:potassium channel subfamily K member 17 n=1 Tax=Microtus oregoni TaxID=111838 RepID=UPI001BB25C27|nr:potassium channel subfamily K member 17 [Microtus oregoni]
MCGPRSPEAPCSARVCRASGTGVLLLSYLAYLVLGAGVFWALEGRAARYSSHIFQRDKWERLKNFTHLDDPALDQLIRDIIQAYKDGTQLLGSTTSMGRWEFVGSFFFSVSTITTISYGNLSPETTAAHLFCIFFALVGIPLNLVVLNRLGDLMQREVHQWMDPSRKYPVWYKNIVSLWILFGMAWQALIIKMILSLLEMPRDTCTCSLRCIKGRSWRQGQEGERGVQSPDISSETFHSGYALSAMLAWWQEPQQPYCTLKYPGVVTMIEM